MRSTFFKIFVGTALALGGASIPVTEVNPDIAIVVLENERGDQVIQEISVEQYHKMGEVDGKNHNPTLDGYTFKEAWLQSCITRRTASATTTNKLEQFERIVQIDNKEYVEKRYKASCGDRSLFQLLIPSAEAAIAFDASLADASVGPATSQIRSFTITGSNTALMVAVQHTTAANVSSITYAGVALTQIHANQLMETGANRADLWYLVGTATGANNLVITMSASDTFRSSALSYTGVMAGGDTGGTDSKATLSWDEVSGNQTLTHTTVSTNTWITFYGRTKDPYTAGTNATFRQNISGVLFAGDNNGASTGSGSNSVTVNRATASDGVLMGLAMKPFVVAVATPRTEGLILFDDN